MSYTSTELKASRTRGFSALLVCFQLLSCVLVHSNLMNALKLTTGT